MVKYAFYLLVFAFIIGGAYLAGYHVGKADRQVEYVTEKVVEYVETDKEKSAIYSSPHAGRDTLLRMYADNEF